MGASISISMIVGIVFIGLGLVFVFVYLSQRNKAKLAESWPITPGTILSSNLVERRHHNSKTHHTTITYEPQVEYEYSLVGQDYIGKKIAFGVSSYDYNTAIQKIAPYPMGGNVQVHYDPDDPSKSVLEPRAAGGVSTLVVAVVFMVVGIAVFVLRFI